MDTVASPCTGICTLNAENVCVGCGRRIDEIAEWGRALESRKRRIVELAALRLAELKTETTESAAR
ncbi:MAG: hypothetical protein NVS9B10_24690 [Nevskia sp.]